MIPERPTLERRILAALDATPPRIPVILGGCGSGRTSLLLRSQEIIGHLASQYIDLERVASTPEECSRAIIEASPFPAPSAGGLLGDTGTPRAAFKRLLGFFDGARTPASGNATFLLDEVLALRTFESFPGLRTALMDTVGLFGRSSNRFVLSSRFATRAMRWLGDASAQFEVIHVPRSAPSRLLAFCSTRRGSRRERATTWPAPCTRSAMGDPPMRARWCAP